MGQCRTKDGTVRGYGQLEDFMEGVFLKTYVASPLSHHDPAVSLKGANDLDISQRGGLGHITISSRSTSGGKGMSSSTGSR